MHDRLVTDNQISTESDVMKNKSPVVQTKVDSAKRNVHSESVQRPSGIQLKSGSVFCLPAKSSHSSRIIIPNKRFLEDDFGKVEVSPKKLKVEQLSADVKKANSATISSTYRCSLGAKRRFKSDACKRDIVAEDSLSKSIHTKHDSSGDNKPDLKSDNKNNKLENVTVDTGDKDLLETETCEEVSPVAATGSILQRPKFCLDQTAVDRSKLAFAKSLRSQIAQETQSEVSDTQHVVSVVCSSAAAASGAQSCSITFSTTCSSWSSTTGEYCILTQCH